MALRPHVQHHTTFSPVFQPPLRRVKSLSRDLRAISISPVLWTVIGMYVEKLYIICEGPRPRGRRPSFGPHPHHDGRADVSSGARLNCPLPNGARSSVAYACGGARPMHTSPRTMPGLSRHFPRIVRGAQKLGIGEFGQKLVALAISFFFFIEYNQTNARDPYAHNHPA